MTAAPAPAAPSTLSAQPWPAAAARPIGHLVCDPHGHVSWTDHHAAAVLASDQVLLLQADGRLGVRSHRLGLLALRSAMRLAVLGTPAEPLVLRHGQQELLVGVHALPEAADGTRRVLLSLRPLNPESPYTGPRNFWRT